MKMIVGGIKVQFFRRFPCAGWIGFHYSKRYKALCVCLVPFFPVRFTRVVNECMYQDSNAVELRLESWAELEARTLHGLSRDAQRV